MHTTGCHLVPRVHRSAARLFLLGHPLGIHLRHHRVPHKSGHQLLECWQPFHRHSNKEASHSEAVLAQEQVLAQAVVLEVQELVLVWV